jgi:hypothetical protein
MTKQTLKIQTTDLQVGLYETAARPKGTYRTVWIMKLRREKGKSRLPRGFGKLSGRII